MRLIWPADSWLYWLAIGAVVLGLGALIRRRARAGLPGLGRARIGVGVLAGVGVIVGLLPSAMLYVLVVVLERSVTPDEAVWWSGALVLLLAAAGVGTWALIGDRSRGRRRCGGCWYDMSATPGLMCPECGREARSERRLFRTRRRWRWAVTAALVVVGAGAMVVVPRVRDGSWPRYVPEAAVVAVMPWLPDGGRMQDRLWYIDGEERWQRGWRRRLFASRARSALHQDHRPMLMTLVIAVLRPEDVDDRTAARLVELMSKRHQLVRGQALRFGPMLLARPEDVIPPALAALDDPAAQTQQMGLVSLMSLGWTQGVAIDAPARVLAMAAADPDPALRGQALAVLGGMRSSDELMANVLAGLTDPQADVRVGAVRAFARIAPDRERAGAMLARMAADPDPDVSGFAVQGLARYGPHTDETLGAIAQGLDRLDWDGAWSYGTDALMHLMKAPLPLETRLKLAERAHAKTCMQDAARDAVRSLGSELTAALAIIERQSAEDPTQDAEASAWRRDAVRWITRAMAADSPPRKR